MLPWPVKDLPIWQSRHVLVSSENFSILVYIMRKDLTLIPNSSSSWTNLQHSNRIGSWIFSSSKCDKDSYQLCITDTGYNHRVCLLFYQLWPVIGFRISYQQGRYTFRIWLCSTWSLCRLYCNITITSVSSVNRK